MNGIRVCWLMVLVLVGAVDGETLKPGDAIRLTLKGVSVEEQQRVSGDYTVGDDGLVSLPLLEGMVRASGLTPVGFARAAERAYKDGGIYASPAINVVAGKGKQAEGAVISVGGHVRRAGQVGFRQGMTVIQAIDAVGGRDPYGGRNVMLIRQGNQYCLDFKNLRHKNIVLESGDSLQVTQKAAIIDRWKGKDESLRDLLVN